MNRLNRRAFLRGLIGSALVIAAVARSPLSKPARSAFAAGYGSAPYGAGPYSRAARYRQHLPLIQKPG